MKKTTIFILILILFSACLEADFITGNRFKEICRYSFDEYGFNINPNLDNEYWFVKTDMLEAFLEKHIPTEDFVIVSHNADHGITDQFLPFMELPNLIHWYAQNVETKHSKLSSIPIGLSNGCKYREFEKIRKKPHVKKKLVYANYAIETNSKERRKCRSETGIPIAKRKKFKEFLKDVAKSYFVISPDGNGVDTHRTWEALYLHAIPIVTRTIHSESYKHLPIIILDSWEEYKNLNLSPQLYEEIWGDFDPETLTVEHFI